MGFEIPERVRRELEERGEVEVAAPEREPLPAPGEARIGKFMAPEHRAPETQRAAAILVYPRTGTQRDQVLALIRSLEGRAKRGATDDEIEAMLGWGLNTVRPRRNELMNDGWVEDSGDRRRTAAGKLAAVWVLTAAGRAELGL